MPYKKGSTQRAGLFFCAGSFAGRVSGKPSLRSSLPPLRGGPLPFTRPRAATGLPDNPPATVRRPAGKSSGRRDWPAAFCNLVVKKDMPYSSLQGLSTSLPSQEEHRERSQTCFSAILSKMDFTAELQNPSGPACDRARSRGHGWPRVCHATRRRTAGKLSGRNLPGLRGCHRVGDIGLPGGC